MPLCGRNGKVCIQEAAGQETRKKEKAEEKAQDPEEYFCIALIIPVFMAVLWAKDMISGRSSLAVMALVNPKVREVMANKDQYPEQLIELLQNNEETVDFVFDYPEKKDTAPADTVGEVVQGQIPLLLQWDERWGYALYADDMIAVNGCGPTAIAMVAAGLTGDNTVTPYKVAQFSAGNGYYAGDSGTSWTLDDGRCTAVRNLRGRDGTERGRGLLCSGKRTSDHMQHETGRLHDDRTLHRTDRS